ncbi:MAG: hypothetical protein ACXAC7_21840, partial [Candidatus Hodarchaeales archaeon]
MAWRRKKSYPQLRDLIFNLSTSPQEQEDIIRSLLSDSSDEAFNILGDYLITDLAGIPVKPIMNYKGELTSFLKCLVAERFNKCPDKEFAKKSLLNTLTKYYSFEELRKSIFDTLKTLNKAHQGAQHVLTVIWTTSPPEAPAKLILYELLPFIPENEQINHLYWFLFTPDYVTQDFPKNFNKGVYKRLLHLQDEPTAILMLIQAIYAGISKQITNWKDYLGDYLKIISEEAFPILYSKLEVLKSHQHKGIVIENMQKVLSVVYQADHEDFLRSYSSNLSDPFVKDFFTHWKEHINSRYKLRLTTNELLCKLEVESSCYNIEIINQAMKYKAIEDIKPLIREIEIVFENIESITAESNIFTNIEILTEILE